MRIAGKTGRRDASALDLTPVPAPETGTTNTASPGSNMKKRVAIKATATWTAAAGPPRNPKIKTEVDTDEGKQGMKDGSLYPH